MFVRDLRERQYIADDNQNIAPNMNMYAASQMEKQEWLRDTNGLQIGNNSGSASGLVQEQSKN